MCRCCQSCLEDLYWNCIEEKFCFDKSIAEYNPDEDEFVTKNNIKIIANGQDNNNLSPIRSQPVKRNESSIFSHAKIHEEDYRREIQTSVPILAPEILAVFNNSQIFQESQKLSRVNTKTGLTPIHSPKSTREKQMASEQKKLIFQLEGNNNELNSAQNTLNESITSSTGSTATLASSKSDKSVNETVNSITIEKKIKFTIADNSPLEFITKSPCNSTCPIIPENEENEYDDVDDAVPDISTSTNDENPNNMSMNSLNRFKHECNNSSSDTLDMGGEHYPDLDEEVVLRPKFKVGGESNKKILMEHRPLRNVYSMPHIRAPTVRNVASETDIFSISGSGIFGSLSMTPEVPSISYAHLPKNYEITPTIEKYKETMSLYKLQTVNKERADSKIVDYSMPRYFKKTLAHSTNNLEELSTGGSSSGIKRTQSKGSSKENVTNKQHHHHGSKKLEKSKRLKQLRDNLPPLIIVHRNNHKKDENKNVH